MPSTTSQCHSCTPEWSWWICHIPCNHLPSWLLQWGDPKDIFHSAALCGVQIIRWYYDFQNWSQSILPVETRLTMQSHGSVQWPPVLLGHSLSRIWIPPPNQYKLVDVDVSSNRVVDKACFCNTRPFLNDLISMFKNLYPHLNFQSVWFIRKRDDGDCFQSWHKCLINNAKTANTIIVNVGSYVILLIPMTVVPSIAIRMTTTLGIWTKETNFISIHWIMTKTLIVHKHFTVNVGLFGTKLDWVSLLSAMFFNWILWQGQYTMRREDSMRRDYSTIGY